MLVVEAELGFDADRRQRQHLRLEPYDLAILALLDELRLAKTVDELV